MSNPRVGLLSYTNFQVTARIPLPTPFGGHLKVNCP